MRKAVFALLAVLAVIAGIFIYNADKSEMAADSCICGGSAKPASEILKTKSIYLSVRKSIVKVSMKTHAGSGIIWDINDKCVVIALNRHLLIEASDASVTFFDGMRADAKFLGLSQQYDIGFIYIEIGEIAGDTLHALRKVRLFDSDDIENSAEARNTFERSYTGLDVIQLGVNLDNGGIIFSKGYITSIDFSTVFNCFVIQTKCYARAGMSGGGMFDMDGRLLGMISGGSESDETYNIPSGTIKNEYQIIIQNNSVW